MRWGSVGWVGWGRVGGEEGVGERRCELRMW